MLIAQYVNHTISPGMLIIALSMFAQTTDNYSTSPSMAQKRMLPPVWLKNVCMYEVRSTQHQVEVCLQVC